MKYLIILISLAFTHPVVSFARSTDSFTERGSFQMGFYGGVRIGPSHIHSKTESSTEILLGDPDPKAEHHCSSIKKSFGSAGLQLGYLYKFDCSPFIISPEVFFTYNPSSMNHQEEGQPDLNKVKTSFSFGTNVRIGGLLTESVFLYGFTGIGCSPFEVQAYDTIDNKQLAKQTKYGVALNYGVGIEHELRNTHRVRLEAGCADYKTMNFSMISNDKLSYHAVRIKPRVKSINLMYSVPF